MKELGKFLLKAYLFIYFFISASSPLIQAIWSLFETPPNFIVHRSIEGVQNMTAFWIIFILLDELNFILDKKTYYSFVKKDDSNIIELKINSKNND